MASVGLDTLLATCDAACSAISLAFAIAAYVAIKKKNIASHRNFMIIATAASFAFLVLFVVRFATFGFKPYAGGAGGRIAHSIALYTHEPLAVINIPLVLAALVLGLRKSYRAHREVAPMAFWIWIYVLVTGLVLYAFLYL